MALIHISSRIPEHLKNEIEAIAKERTVPVSAIVMEALYSFVKTEKDVERVEAIVSSIVSKAEKRILAKFDEFELGNTSGGQ